MIVRNDRGETASGVGGFLQEIRRELAQCETCSNGASGKRLLDWFGAKGTGYMLVRESRGEKDTDRLKGFRDALQRLEHGSYRELQDLFLIESAICPQCSPLLQLEIRALRPRLVLTLGRAPTEAVLGRKIKMAEEHATRHRIEDTVVMPLVIPSFGATKVLKDRGTNLKHYRNWLTGFLGSLIEAHQRQS